VPLRETHLQNETSRRNKVAKWHGWLGASLLLLIIPVKAARWAGSGSRSTFLVGIAPSLLGPAGLLFLLLSGNARLTRRSLLRTALVVLVIALGLEFAQLCPRPGILVKIRYTFDWWDVVASIVSVCAACGVAFITTEKNPTRRDAEP
jgi:hypothetical protein